MTLSRTRLILLGLAVALGTFNPGAAQENSTRGKIVGGVLHAPPDWFKESFLEIADDVDEASEAGKHVMLFFELNGCPYCDRMLEESFEREPLTSYIRQHFDTIAINIQGDREIAFNDEISVTEKELGELLKVSSTPALLFLNEDNKTILRVNGYRATERFQKILEYVATRTYQNIDLADYLQARLERNVYKLKANPRFSETSDLSSIDGPLMVIFEDGSCYDCPEFHDGILAHPLVQQEMAPYQVVRLDADSDEAVIDVNGNQTTAARMVEQYKMIYRPGVLLFDEGNLVKRYDSLVFPHHFKEGLRYVAGDYYQQTDYRSYSTERTETLLSEGVTIDLGRPQ